MFIFYRTWWRRPIVSIFLMLVILFFLSLLLIDIGSIIGIIDFDDLLFLLFFLFAIYFDPTNSEQILHVYDLLMNLLIRYDSVSEIKVLHAYYYKMDELSSNSIHIARW